MVGSKELDRLISRVFGLESSASLQFRPLSGGDISQAYRIERDGESLAVVKVRADSPEDFFPVEARGLTELGRAIDETHSRLLVPEVLAVGNDGILLSFVREIPRSGDFGRSFGRQMAEFHQASAERMPKRYGAEEDNFIGLSVQENRWDSANNWPEFFARRRLGFQLKLAESTGSASSALEDAVLRVIEGCSQLLPQQPAPSLLHGDLWGGNYMVSHGSRAVLIDPACYRGHNEADLAMTELFGGFPRDFYLGYAEVLPPDADYPRRKALYNLYHMLNHLNLFGRGYESSVLSLVRQTGL